MRMFPAAPMLAAVIMLVAVSAMAAPANMDLPMRKSTAGSMPAPARHAQGTTSKPTRVHIDAAWVRAAPPGAMMMAGYMRVYNDGKTPLIFVSAHSEAFGTIELHRTQIKNGVSSMRPASDQIIAPGGSMTLDPGGLHLMLMQPKRALKVGDSVRFQLDFADGSSSVVFAAVSSEAPGK